MLFHRWTFISKLTLSSHLLFRSRFSFMNTNTNTNSNSNNCIKLHRSTSLRILCVPEPSLFGLITQTQTCGIHYYHHHHRRRRHRHRHPSTITGICHHIIMPVW